MSTKDEPKMGVGMVYQSELDEYQEEISELKAKNKELYETLYSARFTIEYAEDEHTKIQMIQKIDALLTKYRG